MDVQLYMFINGVWQEYNPKPAVHSHAWSEITGKPTTFTPSSHSHSISNITSLQSTLDDKVDKVSGKGLSTNDYTTTEKNKLAGIASGAEVNVQVDWNETNSSSDAFIKNKPSLEKWTEVWSGNRNLNSNRESWFQAIVPSGSYIGKRIAIEVQYGNGTAYTSKIIFGVLGSSSTTVASPTISRGIGWSYFDGIYLRVKTLYTYTSTSNTSEIYVGYLKTLYGKFDGTTIEWSTSQSETLYMRKIWVIE